MLSERTGIETTAEMVAPVGQVRPRRMPVPEAVDENRTYSVTR